MIKFSLLLTLLGISILLNSCSQSHMILNDFVFEMQSFPCNCSIIEPSENEPLPFNIPNNPYISSDTSFTRLATYLLKTDELNSSIKTALFSVYQCKNEIGINGIEFDKIVNAEKCEVILKNLKSDTARFNVFRNKNIVIQLWRDDVTDSCYYKFRELILERLEIDH